MKKNTTKKDTKKSNAPKGGAVAKTRRHYPRKARTAKGDDTALFMFELMRGAGCASAEWKRGVAYFKFNECAFAVTAKRIPLTKDAEGAGASTKDENAKGKKEVVRDWLVREYPDERRYLGDFSKTVTFSELARRMRNGENFYEILDCGESTQREYCFTRLAELYKTDYGYWYDLWLAN